MENEAVAFGVAMGAALIACGVAYLVMRKRRSKLWFVGLIVLVGGGAGLYVLSGNRTDDIGLTMLLATMFGALPGTVGWVFGGVYGMLRSRGKAT